MASTFDIGSVTESVDTQKLVDWLERIVLETRLPFGSVPRLPRDDDDQFPAACRLTAMHVRKRIVLLMGTVTTLEIVIGLIWWMTREIQTTFSQNLIILSAGLLLAQLLKLCTYKSFLNDVNLGSDNHISAATVARIAKIGNYCLFSRLLRQADDEMRHGAPLA